jgi:hypothetical protein
MRGDGYYYGNEGGYPYVGGAYTPVLKPYLEGGFLSGLKAALGPDDYVYKVTRNITGGSYGAWTKESFAAEIFIDTEKEVLGCSIYGDSTSEEDLVQTALYAAPGGTAWRIKKYNGSAVFWWLGSPHYAISDFCAVAETGIPQMYAAYYSLGVVPAFCIH